MDEKSQSAFNFMDSSTSPDYQFSSGTVSLVSLQCSVAQGSFSYGTCPATLADYHWGSTTLFASHKIDPGTWGSQSKFHTSYLLAAPSSKIALIADYAVSYGRYQLEFDFV